jgi:hypothetical protein
MTLADRELIVSRIVAGCVRCKIKDEDGKPRYLYIKSPTNYYKYVGQELYHEVLRDSRFQGLCDENQLTEVLIKRGLWSQEKEEKIPKLEKDIEQFKVNMYSFAFKSNELKAARKLLQTAKNDLQELIAEKKSYDWLTATGAALLARNRFLMAMSLYINDNEQLLTEDTYWTFSAHILDQVLEFYSKQRLEESVCREVVRTEPWRSLWGSRKATGTVFGKSSVELTDEQKALVMWSSVYDSIYEHPECPPESVLGDDDLVDGWLIIQHRKRNKDIDSSRLDSVVTNEKIRNSEEIYVIADTKEDAQAVDNLNDDVGKLMKRKREALLRKRGEVKEIDMPDTRARLVTAISEKLSKER